MTGTDSWAAPELGLEESTGRRLEKKWNWAFQAEGAAGAKAGVRRRRVHCQPTNEAQLAGASRQARLCRAVVRRWASSWRHWEATAESEWGRDGSVLSFRETPLGLKRIGVGLGDQGW